MQDEVIYRYLTGKCSPEEEQQIQEWYQQDPENHQRDIDRFVSFLRVFWFIR